MPKVISDQIEWQTNNRLWALTSHFESFWSIVLLVKCTLTFITISLCFTGPCSDYASLDLTREMASSIERTAMKPPPVVSRLRYELFKYTITLFIFLTTNIFFS